MWEVMGYGERPYWNWSNQDVIKAIEKGIGILVAHTNLDNASDGVNARLGEKLGLSDLRI